MTTPRTAADHRVYPDGPACSPDCPGEWSQYHDGYADGYERAEASASPASPLDAHEWMDIRCRCSHKLHEHHSTAGWCGECLCPHFTISFNAKAFALRDGAK